MDITAYRKTYFALCKALGLGDEERHLFNHAQVGKYSTGDFGVNDWRVVVAELQRRNGQSVAPGKPHIRGKREEKGGMISPAQLERIEHLAGRIAWRTSPEAFVRARLLKPMRRDGWSGRWDALMRSEATNVITVFQRMTEKDRT